MPGVVAGQITVDPFANMLIVFVTVCNNEPYANASTCSPNNLNTTVLEIDGNSGAVARAFPLDLGLFAVNFETGTIYEIHDCPNPGPHGVTDPYLPNCGFLSSYDLRFGSLISNVSLSAAPYEIAVNPKIDAVYVETTQTFLVINGTTDQVEASSPLSFVSSPVIEVNSNTNTVYALGVNQSNNQSYTVLTAINGTSGKIVYTAAIGSACSVSSNRYYLNPFTDQIYATGSNATLGTNYFLVINASDGQLTNMLSINGDEYIDSTFNPQMNETYLALTNPDGTASQLLNLPWLMTQTYVNPSLLSFSNCNDLPV